LLASEVRLRQVMDLVPHLIFAKDRQGRFLLANRAVAEAYGTTVEQLTGRPMPTSPRTRKKSTGFCKTIWP